MFEKNSSVVESPVAPHVTTVEYESRAKADERSQLTGICVGVAYLDRRDRIVHARRPPPDDAPD
jgi:hypothetical protein